MSSTTRNPAAWGADGASKVLNSAVEGTEDTQASLSFQADLERAVTSGAIIALRKRAAAIRRRAASGVTVIDRPFTITNSSESAQTLKIAADRDAIAADLEGGGAR
jgi:hypothetical protein